MVKAFCCVLQIFNVELCNVNTIQMKFISHILLAVSFNASLVVKMDDNDKIVRLRGLPWSATASDVVKFLDGRYQWHSVLSPLWSHKYENMLTSEMMF